MNKVISQAPCRISLFGGGTDIPGYSDKYGGICISMAINIRQHIEMRDFSFADPAIEDQIIFPTLNIPEKASVGFYEAFCKEFDLEKVSILANSDSPIESGLGSSASASVALIGALSKLKGLKMSEQEIAEKAWDIEVNKLNLFGGKQDQYAAVFGGFNKIEFDKGIKVTPFTKEVSDKIYPSLTLFYLGRNRKSATIQEGLRNPTSEQVKTLNGIKKIAQQAVEPILKGDVERIGYLLSKSWFLKKKSNKGVSDDFIDRVYERGIELGALGGKVLGAGGGGHFLFIVPPKIRQEFITTMENEGLKWVNFSIDWDGLVVKEE